MLKILYLKKLMRECLKKLKEETNYTILFYHAQIIQYKREGVK